MSLDFDLTSDSASLLLLEEQASIARRRREGDTVRVLTVTKAIEKHVAEELSNERIEVEHVAIGRHIDAVPLVREEGEVTIIPIVEEILVVEKRLVLKEEVRIRRVRVPAVHQESVILCEQDVIIERTKPGETRRSSLVELAPIARQQALKKVTHMTNETIIAIYDLAEHAALAVRDLESAGVPTGAVTQHAKDGSTTSAVTTSRPRREEGFWANLFGGGQRHEHDTSIYDRSLEDGSTIVTVTVPEQHLSLVMDILEQHNPIDIDERAATYNGSQTTTTTHPTHAAPTSGTTGPDGADGHAVSLSEEELAVGKRAINRGTTRVRRFVVETPVEEHVSLRDETVSVERRPVSDARPITDADFTDKVVEMTETDEEAVVSKTARVKEEVVVRKDASERTETVRDTVRREDVEITKESEAERSTSTAEAVPAAPTPKI